MTVATTRQRRWLLAALAAAVLAAAIGLVIMNRGSAAPGAATPAAARGDDPGTGSGENFPTPSASGGPVARRAPAIDPAGGAAPSPATTRDDPRDHRTGPAVEMVERTTTPPRSGPVIWDQKLSLAAAADVKPVAMECAKQVPAEGRGPKPVIQVRLQVSVKDGRMNVDDVLTDLRDVPGGDELATKVSGCVKQGLQGKSYDSGAQEELPHYQITVPMRLP